MTRPIICILVLGALLATGCARATLGAKPFNVVDASIPDLRRALAEERVTSRQLVVEYLTRIAFYEDQLKAIITVNPKVLAEAEALDRERSQGTIRGPLHGIPIALEDNIHTMDMPTTGGAVAFEGYRPPYEATVTRNLRAAGAITIAKTVLTELANWVAGAPTPMPGTIVVSRATGSIPTIRDEIRARRRMTGGRSSPPEVRARASARRPASGRRTWERRRRARF